MASEYTRSRCGKAVTGFVLVLALLAPGIATDHARAAASESRTDQMLALTNEARATHDKAALDLNAKLSRYATRHSRQMANAGTLFHTEDLADKLSGLDWSMGGENVGVGPSLTDLQDAFMGSRTTPPQHPPQRVRPRGDRDREVRRDTLGDGHLLRLAPPDLAVDARSPGEAGAPRRSWVTAARDQPACRRRAVGPRPRRPSERARDRRRGWSGRRRRR